MRWMVDGFRDNSEARWRAGEIDDDAFENARAARFRRITLVVLGPCLVLLAARLVMGRLDRGLAIEPLPLAMILSFSALVGWVVALRFGNLARSRARSLVLKRLRDRVEANPGMVLSVAEPGDPQDEKPIHGSYLRSKRFAYFNMAIGLFFAALTIAIALLGGVGQALLLSPVAPGYLLWGFLQWLDARPYLDISVDGIWYRPWGKERHAFAEFKAVYARDNAIQEGIAFVPQDLTLFRRKLPWPARIALRSGGGEAAHIGTLTLWTNRVDLPRDWLLRGLQTKVVRAARLYPHDLGQGG